MAVKRAPQWYPEFEADKGYRIEKKLLEQQLMLSPEDEQFLRFAVTDRDGNVIDPDNYKLYLHGYRYKYPPRSSIPVEPMQEWIEDFPTWP
ncbi:hypothetical protein AMJ71_09560 [candidate division TA06 bacterium SM1_40]|uniref:Uncharacterized protein n=1 Tax=candidate division TA06 bacterium SM1_40 TaxID=1703773 RepID=A0A0S8JBG7_UNCT6|nr:MAG: hypothetical protein AMJ71_09560 [candidate division TA06 bacterium SM1_40]